MRKKISRLPSHLLTLLQVFLKCLQQPSGSFLHSSSKLISTKTQRNQKIAHGSQLKNWWRILMLLWLHYSDLRKSLMLVNCLLVTLLTSKSNIYQCLNLTPQSSKTNQKQLLDCVLGSSILSSSMTLFFKLDHSVNS